jgi:hypothetical protein
MSKELATYSNKSFDEKLSPFLDALDKFMGISTKGQLVLLSGLGLMDSTTMSSSWKVYAPKGRGRELRANTDSEYNAALDVVLAKLAKTIGEYQISEILTSADLYNKYVTYLMNIASIYCENLLKEDFIEYKNGVNANNCNGFIVLASNLLERFKSEEPEF